MIQKLCVVSFDLCAPWEGNSLREIGSVLHVIPTVTKIKSIRIIAHVCSMSIANGLKISNQESITLCNRSYTIDQYWDFAGVKSLNWKLAAVHQIVNISNSIKLNGIMYGNDGDGDDVLFELWKDGWLPTKIDFCTTKATLNLWTNGHGTITSAAIVLTLNFRITEGKTKIQWAHISENKMHSWLFFFEFICSVSLLLRLLLLQFVQSLFILFFFIFLGNIVLWGWDDIIWQRLTN